MRPRSLLILAIIVALFGAYLYFVERKLPTTDERRAQAKKVLDVDPDEVDRVTVDWSEESVLLTRDDADADAVDGLWHLREPMNAIADATAISDLVRDLADLEKSRTIENIDRAEAGLAPPRAIVTLRHGTDDAQTVLEIGADVPASDAMIVAVAGGTDAYQVPNTLWSTVTKPPGDWRDRQIFRSNRAEIAGIRLVPTPHEGDDDSESRSDLAEIVLAKRDNDFWVTYPVNDRADRDLINTLISQITDLRVTDFLDDPTIAEDAAAEDALVPPGLTPPFGRVEVTLDGQAEPFVVDVGAPAATEGTIHARVDGQIFIAQANALRTALARPVVDWRSRAWTSWQPFDIDQATIEDEHGTVLLARADGEWLRDGHVIDFTVASDVLYALGAVRAIEVLERASLDEGDLAKASMTISLEAEEGRSERLQVYSSESRLLATTAGRDAVLVLAPDALDDWMAKLASLRAAETTDETENENSDKNSAEPGTATTDDDDGSDTGSPG